MKQKKRKCSLMQNLEGWDSMGFLEEFERWCRKAEVRQIVPREVGIPRKVAKDEVDVVEYVNESKFVDCYASIFASWQVRQRRFDTIFLDVDEHNGGDWRSCIESAYKKLQKVLEVLEGYEVRTYFTGRGFHVYCDFPVTHLELYGEVVRKWVDKKGLRAYVDDKVVGDIRRMARIPATINSKVGLRMIEIDPGWSVDEIIRHAKIGKPNVRDGELNKELAKELEEMEQREKERLKEMGIKRDVEVDDKTITYFLEHNRVSELPACIRKAIETLIEVGELDHYWRVAASIFLLKVWGFERTKKLYEMFADDYEEGKTEYQLRFIQSKGYMCYSCKKLKLMGICPYNELRKCPFYVLSNGWVERLIGRVEAWQ